MATTTRTRFAISPADRKKITAAARRLVGKERVKVEIRRGWMIERGADEPVSTFNRNGRKWKDVDDNYTFAYTFAEFNRHAKDDPRCSELEVELDVLVCTTSWSGWEPNDFLYPRFVDGKLVGFRDPRENLTEDGL